VKEVDMGKKLVFAVALVGVLVGSTLGGLALADGGGSPNYGSSLLSDMRVMLDKVGFIEEEIRDLNIEEVKENLRVILGNVSTFEAPEFREQLTRIAGQVHDIDRQIGNITMETMSNNVEVGVNQGQTKSFVICGDSYPDVRHVYITIGAMQEIPPGYEVEDLDIYGYVHITPDCSYPLERYDINPSGGGMVTYEFNASEWEIRAYMDAYADHAALYSVQYAVTITYPN
jgi:hypothetical protein